MEISSFYTVYQTPDMNKMLKRFARTGSLKVVHQFETDDFKYFVLSDNSGNNTDFIEFKNKDVKDSFYAVRINTDSFAEMAVILKENGFAPKDGIVETDTMKLALFVSKNKEPNILLFEHKK